MPWTPEQKIDYLLRLPWTLVPDQSEGDRLLRVREIPAAVGTGVTDEQLAADLWQSLEAALDAYVEFDDPIPLPPGAAPLPWTVAAPAPPFACPTEVDVPKFAPRVVAETAQQPATSIEEPVPVAA